MTDFTPTPEAVEAVTKALAALPQTHERFGSEGRIDAEVAIAAFVEAERLSVEYTWANDTPSSLPPTHERVYGPWRRRD